MKELVTCVQNALPEPWNKKVGRPKPCGLYQAVQTACIYLRQTAHRNSWATCGKVSQPTVSRYVAALVPIIETVLKEFVPDAKEAIEVVNGKACLVDGTITPCWSYADRKELWSRKKGTTGFNAQLVCLLYAAKPSTFLTHYPDVPTMRKRSSRLRSPRSSQAPVVQSATKAIKDTKALPRHVKLHPAASSVYETKRKQKCLLAASARRTTCRPLQVMADRPLRLSSPLQHLSAGVRCRPRFVLLLDHGGF